MGGRAGLTDDELSQLTEEEMAALMDEPEEDEAEEAAEASATAEAGEAKAAGEEEADPSEPAATEEPAAPAPAAAKPPAAEEPAPPAPAHPAPVASPAPHYEAPADAKERLAALDAESDRIAKEFDDGELTAAEERAKQRAIDNQRYEIREQMLQAKMAQDNKQSAWFQRDVPTFLAENTQYAAGSLLYRMLDAKVKELQTTAANPFDPGLLKTAHEAIQAELGGVIPPKPAPAVPGKGLPTRQIPPTLAHVPAADISETGDGGAFAMLDRLANTDAAAYEKAVAALSDEQREAYLASA